MTHEIHFEIAEVKDCEAICTLVNSAYRGESSKRGWTTEAELLDGQRTDRLKISEMIAKRDSIILLAQLKDKLVGCVNLMKKENECYLGMLTVSPENQNSGIGKDLLRKAEAWARDQKAHAIYMTVITLRRELISWYERHGYHRTGQFEKFPYGDERFGLPKRMDLEFEILRKKFDTTSLQLKS